MKKTDQTVEEMIMRSHYLNALELESGAEEPLSDMEREAFLETMQDLKEIIKNSNDMIRLRIYKISWMSAKKRFPICVI